MHSKEQNYLLYFFIFTYLFSWSFWIPFVLNVRVSIYLALLGILGPAIIGIIITILETGKTGVNDLLKGVIKWNVNFRWYLFVLVFPFMVTYLSIYTNYIIEGNLIEFSGIKSWTSIPILFSYIFFLQGPFEEIGWRGYALPRLQKKYSSLKSSIILGVIWAFWHTPLFLFSSLHEGLPIWLYFLHVIGISILMTWVFNSTGRSILLVMLLHTSINMSGVIAPILKNYEEHKIPYIFMLVATWVIDIMLIMKFGSNLNLNKVNTGQNEIINNSK